MGGKVGESEKIGNCIAGRGGSFEQLCVGQYGDRFKLESRYQKVYTLYRILSLHGHEETTR